MASTTRRRRVGGRGLYRLAGTMLSAGLLAGCSLGGASSPTTTASRAPSPTARASATPTPQPTYRTVLSPDGLNVRAAPTKSARVIGTAAKGTTLTTLGYTGRAGGWFKVRGETLTGWITAQPTLTAPGQFRLYGDVHFTVLYPATWTESALPAAAPGSSSVIFRPASGPGDVFVTVAPSAAALPHGRSGYGQKSVSEVVVCGTTAGLVVYQQAGTATTSPSPTSAPESLTYLAEIRIAVNKHQGLGLYADLPDLGPSLQTFNEFVDSATFHSPHC